MINNHHALQVSLDQALKLKFAVNTCGRNKDWDFRKLAANFQDKEGTIEDVLQHIKAGHAICAGLLGGKWRSKANVIGSHWLLLDIDNSDVVRDLEGKPIKDEFGNSIKVYLHQLTIEEALAHPFIKKHCALLYTTKSHKPDWHKFRLIFFLPQYVEGADTVEACTRKLMQQLPHDPACKDASRVFYGNTEAEFFIVNPNATLPAEWVTEAIAIALQEREEYQQRIKEIESRRQQWRELSDVEGWNIDALIEQALSYIPPRSPGSGNYDECRSVLMALTAHYGATEAEVIAERWSPSIKGTTWNIPAKIRSFRRNGVTIGSLFHIAKQYGFQFPKRQYEPSRPLDKIISHEEWESHPNRIKKDFSNFKSLFTRALAKVSSKVFRGFGSSKTRRNATPALNNSADKTYQREERKEIWRSAVKKQWKYILDNSSGGSGKSHTVGNSKATDFDVDKIFYLAADHRNPTTLLIEENFTDLPTRHGGLIKDPTRKTPMGNDFRVNQNEDNIVLEKTPGTCHRWFLFEKLESKNIPNIKSGNNPICEGCHLLGACGHTSGNGFGFKYERMLALTQSQIRAHPDSMPKVDDFNYDKIGLFWDETDTLFKAVKKVKITLDDIEKLAGHLALVDAELLTQLQPLLTKLYQIVSSEIDPPSYYGWNHVEIKAKLPTIPEDIENIIAKIEAILQPDLSFLQEKADEIDAQGLRGEPRQKPPKKRTTKQQTVVQTALDGIGTEEVIFEPKNQPAKTTPTPLTNEEKALQKKVNRILRRKVLSENSTELNQVLVNWLPDFLRVWAGANGAFKCFHGEFTISTLDTRHREIATAAKFNIFLSATMRREDLALVLGVDPDEILVIKCQPQDYSNLNIVHIIGMGNLGKDRRDPMINRVAALKLALTAKHPDIAFLEWKAQAALGEGYHFRDGRGINRFQGNSALASIGIPYPNVGEVLTEYITLTSEQINLASEHPGFQKFLDAKTQSEIAQESWRLRAQLRPDEQLTYYFVGDYDIHFLLDVLPGASFTTVEAFTITPEAGDKEQRTRWGILQAARKLLEDGQKLGQTALASVVGITQGRLSQIAQEFGGWASFQKLLILLLESLYNKTNNFEEVDQDLMWWAKTYLPLAINDYSPPQVISEVAIVLKQYGWHDFSPVLDILQPETKAQLISYLVSFLPEQMQQLFIEQFLQSATPAPAPG